jgi:hypothetical protein
MITVLLLTWLLLKAFTFPNFSTESEVRGLQMLYNIFIILDLYFVARFVSSIYDVYEMINWKCLIKNNIK